MAISKDKIYHFIVCFLIVIICGRITVFLEHPIDYGIGFLSGICAGFLKELYDEFKKDSTGFDWNNILADFLGSLLGLLILFIL